MNPKVKMAEIKLSKNDLRGSMLAYTDRMRELSQQRTLLSSVLKPEIVPDSTFQYSFKLGNVTRMTQSEELPQKDEPCLTIEPLYRSEIKTRSQSSRNERRKSKSFLPNINFQKYRTTTTRTNAYNMSDVYESVKSSAYSVGTTRDSQVEIVDILPYPDFNVETYQSPKVASKPVSSQNKPMTRNRGMNKKNYYARKKRPPTPPKSKDKKPKKRRLVNKPNKRRGGNNGKDDPKKFPIKKQFVWSDQMETELKNHIPPRLPGSKLKPNYKRTSTGDIYIPEMPIEIELDRLATINMESPTEKQLSGAYAEEIKALMERNARRRAEAAAARKKAKKKVKFVLPPGYSDSESSSSDDDGESGDEEIVQDLSINDVSSKDSVASEAINDENADDVSITTARLNSSIVGGSRLTSASSMLGRDDRTFTPSSVIIEMTKPEDNKSSGRRSSTMSMPTLIDHG
ncbi:uncharacterized protein LOC144443500 [Glandiceps talaboti]